MTPSIASLRAALAGLALLVAAMPAPAQTLRIGLAEDADALDPTLARTFVGRVVFAALCDKLFDIDEKLPSCRSSPRATNGRPTTRH